MLMYNIMQLGYIRSIEISTCTSPTPSLQLIVACSYSERAQTRFQGGGVLDAIYVGVPDLGDLKSGGAQGDSKQVYDLFHTWSNYWISIAY